MLDSLYKSVHFIQVASPQQSLLYGQSDGGHRGGSADDWYMNTAHVRNNLRNTCCNWRWTCLNPSRVGGNVIVEHRKSNAE